MTTYIYKVKRNLWTILFLQINESIKLVIFVSTWTICIFKYKYETLKAINNDPQNII
jgi:hypothetical protein